jgi:hypothetical protein
MRNAPLLVFVGLLTTALGPALGQVSARQGTAPPPVDVAFASPMVLELPLPNIEVIQPDSYVKLAEVRKYVCDKNVRLFHLTLSKQYKGPRKARSLELVLSGSVLVEESYDRRLDLAVGIKGGDEVLGTQSLRNLSAEERRVTPFRIVVPVGEAKLLAAYAAEPRPTIELTLTVRDDS